MVCAVAAYLVLLPIVIMAQPVVIQSPTKTICTSTECNFLIYECTAAVCAWECSGHSSCLRSVFLCGRGSTCELNCSGQLSCNGITVFNYDNTNAFRVNCLANFSCWASSYNVDNSALPEAKQLIDFNKIFSQLSLIDLHCFLTTTCRKNIKDEPKTVYTTYCELVPCIRGDFFSPKIFFCGIFSQCSRKFHFFGATRGRHFEGRFYL